MLRRQQRGLLSRHRLSPGDPLSPAGGWRCEAPLARGAGTRTAVTTPEQLSKPCSTEYDDGVNGLGRLTGVTIGNVGTIAYDHDARGNVTGETRSFNLGDLGANISDSRTVHYQYNALGQEVESRYQNTGSPDTRIYTEYDRRGLPERALWQGSYIAVELGSIERNVAGRPVRLHTGPVGGRYTGERRWDYDDLGRVLGDRFSGPKGLELFRHDYSYGGDEVMALHMDVKGRERNMVFDYDSRHQIVAASDDVGYEAAFAYTAAGRVASAFVDAQSAVFAHGRDVIYSYDDVEPEAVAELTNADSGDRYASYAYDRAGNLISRKPGNGQSSIGHYFDYDGDDQQRRVVATDGSSELYIYDHSGNRMIALTRAPGGATVKARQWFGGSEIWYGPSGNVSKSWVHVGLGTPLARIENGARLEYTFHSMLGHMVLATDRGGLVKGGYNYGPFGEVLDSVGSADNHLRRFNGKEFDVASGLSYYGARYYDLESMSWTQADPLYRFVPDLAFDEPRRMNLYVFTLNNPVQFVDPDGRDSGNLPHYVDVRMAQARMEFANDVGHGKALAGVLGLALVGISLPVLASAIVTGGAVGVGKEVGSYAVERVTGIPTGLGGMARNLMKRASKRVAKRMVREFTKKIAKKACFAEGTLVETSEGLRPIEVVEPGDLVWSRNEATAEEAWKPVARVFVTHDRTLLDLELIDACGDAQELLVTEEHPLWARNGWLRVGELQVGDRVWTRVGWAAVVSLADSGLRETVYNLEVSDFHTYFVGDIGVWAHNTCFPKAGDLAKAFGTNAKDFHRTVKPEILKDAGSFMKKIGAKNPDIGIDKAGKIMLRNPKTGKTVTTDLAAEWFRL